VFVPAEDVLVLFEQVIESVHLSFTAKWLTAQAQRRGLCRTSYG
jgi:hypothetical protein